MEQPPLLTKTLDLLRKCDLPLSEVATKSNLGLEWLKKLKYGAIPDPSVNKIQQLHDFLVKPRKVSTAEPRT
jgi:predicted permease